MSLHTNCRYRHLPAKARSDAAGMITQTLPMAAMFMRNKVLSWLAFFLALQSYLSEPINKPQGGDGQPPLLRLVFAVVSLVACYIEFFFPSTSASLRRAAQIAAETAAEATRAASETQS